MVVEEPGEDAILEIGEEVGEASDVAQSGERRADPSLLLHLLEEDVEVLRGEADGVDGAELDAVRVDGEAHAVDIDERADDDGGHGRRWWHVVAVERHESRPGSLHPKRHGVQPLLLDRVGLVRIQSLASLPGHRVGVEPDEVVEGGVSMLTNAPHCVPACTEIAEGRLVVGVVAEHGEDPLLEVGEEVVEAPDAPEILELVADPPIVVHLRRDGDLELGCAADGGNGDEVDEARLIEHGEDVEILDRGDGDVGQDERHGRRGGRGGRWWWRSGERKGKTRGLALADVWAPSPPQIFIPQIFQSAERENQTISIRAKFDPAL